MAVKKRTQFPHYIVTVPQALKERLKQLPNAVHRSLAPKMRKHLEREVTLAERKC